MSFVRIQSILGGGIPASSDNYFPPNGWYDSVEQLPEDWQKLWTRNDQVHLFSTFEVQLIILID